MPEEVTASTEVPSEVALTASSVKTMIESAFNGLDKKFKSDFTKFTDTFKKVETPAATTEGTSTTVDPKYAALERSLAELNEKYSASETKALKAETSKALSDALSTFSFASDKAREVAMATLESQMKRSDDGKFYIGDRDVKTAVAEQMKELPGPLKPLSVGSSNAVATQSNPNVSLSNLIKPNMSKAEITQAYAEFSRILGA